MGRVREILGHGARRVCKAGLEEWRAQVVMRKAEGIKGGLLAGKTAAAIGRKGALKSSAARFRPSNIAAVHR